MKCGLCGAPNQPDAIFCTACGALLAAYATPVGAHTSAGVAADGVGETAPEPRPPISSPAQPDATGATDDAPVPWIMPGPAAGVADDDRTEADDLVWQPIFDPADREEESADPGNVSAPSRGETPAGSGPAWAPIFAPASSAGSGGEAPGGGQTPGAVAGAAEPEEQSASPTDGRPRGDQPPIPATVPRADTVRQPVWPAPQIPTSGPGRDKGDGQDVVPPWLLLTRIPPRMTVWLGAMLILVACVAGVIGHSLTLAALVTGCFGSMGFILVTFGLVVLGARRSERPS